MLKEEDNNVFDYDDVIVFTKKCILIQKNEFNNNDIKKISELDGNWSLEKTKESNEDFESLPDYWISLHQTFFYKLFTDLKNKSFYNALFDTLTFPDLCEYLEDVHLNPSKSKYNWIDCNKYKFKIYNLKFPSFRDWVSFFIEDLMFLYESLSSSFDFGCFDRFIAFAFNNSNSNRRLPKN